MDVPIPQLRRWAMRAGAASLRVSIQLTVLLTAVILVAAAISRGDSLREADADARNIARAAAETISRNLELYDLSLRAVLRNLDDPRANALDADLRQSLLFDGAAHDGHFGFINVLNEKGEVIADSASGIPRGGNFATRDYFRAQRDNSGDTLFIGRPFLTDAGQPATIPISRRITKQDGSFGGVVVGTLRLAYIGELFSHFDIGAHGTMTLLRDDGMVLQRYPVAAGEIGHIPADPPALGPGALRGVDWEDPVDQRSRRMALERVDGLPLTVAVGLTYQDIYQLWKTRFGPILVALFFLFVLTTAVQTTERKARGRTEIQRRYIAMMGHEARDPLQSIVTSAELIRRSNQCKQEAVANLELVLQESVHLDDVMNRLFDYGQLGGNKPVSKCVDLHALIEDRRGPVARLALSKGLRLLFQVDPDVPRWVTTDPARLRIMLSNLLSNAVKYTEHGSVTLRVSRTGDSLRLAVADTGVGVPPDLRDRLAKPFDRLGRDQTTISGSGLGLYIVHHLASELDGTFDYWANPGGGSIFTLTIKLARAEAPDPEAPATPAQTSLRLLLADDSDTNRQPVAKMLREAGHAVIEVRTGEEAVRLAGQQYFDALLLDMCMPGIGGLEAARRIRLTPGCGRHVPIIALTGHVPGDEWQRWRAAGVSHRLGKPCHAEELLDVLKTVLSTVNRTGPVLESPGVPDSGAASEDPPIVDWRRFRSISALMGDAAVRDYIEKLHPRIGELLSRLNGDVRRIVAPEFQDTLHAIANEAAELGLAALAEHCRSLERASGSVQDLTRTVDRTLPTLRQLLDRLENGRTREDSSD